ncbi:MAG: PKD domain-containing protein [Bacteroidia bacterium]
MRSLYLSLLLLCYSFICTSQTFNGTGGHLPDYTGVAIPVYLPCVVSGLPNNIDSVHFGLERVCIDITHTYDRDLEIQLMSPDSMMIMLSNRNGDGDDNFTGTCFRGHTANQLLSDPGNNPPFTGEYDPDGDLALYNDGRDPNGTWYLVVTDLAGSDSGDVNSFSITFGSSPTSHSIMPCSRQDATRCQCPDGSQDCDLIPDMTASAQAILDGSYEVTDTLYVNNATPNIGWGPLEIHGINTCYCDTVLVSCSTPVCPNGQPPKQLVEQTIYHKTNGAITTYNRPAGTMTYHPQHGHIHLDGWAEYTLRQPMIGKQPYEWPVVGTGNKQSYCLVNLGQCTDGNGYCVDTTGNILGRDSFPNYGLGTVTGCTTDQGIYVGYLDIYSAALYGQWITLDSVCNGDYYVVSFTDPNNWILEMNDSNNWAAVPWSLTHQLNLPFPTVNFTYTANANTVNFTNSTTDFDSLVWDFGDGDSSTLLNPVHVYSSTGTYNVVLTAYNRCGFHQQVQSFSITLTGISKVEPEDIFAYKVYPNPTKEGINIDFSLAQKVPVKIEVRDAIGRLVYSPENTTLNMGSHHYQFNFEDLGLQRGIYIISLLTNDKALYKRISFVKD